MAKLEEFKKLLPSIFFNIAETILIYLIGLLLNLEVNHIILVMLTFMISRGLFGEVLHFATWYRCLIYSLLVMLSLFVLLKVDLIISIMFAIFSALILTRKIKYWRYVDVE